MERHSSRSVLVQMAFSWKTERLPDASLRGRYLKHDVAKECIAPRHPVLGEAPDGGIPSRKMLATQTNVRRPKPSSKVCKAVERVDRSKEQVKPDRRILVAVNCCFRLEAL